ncbi:hypothetical protein LguiA_011881 [Lonicera macranthoides]
MLQTRKKKELYCSNNNDCLGKGLIEIMNTMRYKHDYGLLDSDDIGLVCLDLGNFSSSLPDLHVIMFSLTGDRHRTVMRTPQVLLHEGTKKTVSVNFMDLCKTYG